MERFKINKIIYGDPILRRYKLKLNVKDALKSNPRWVLNKLEIYIGKKFTAINFKENHFANENGTKLFDNSTFISKNCYITL